jgi:hypothetical protein
MNNYFYYLVNLYKSLNDCNEIILIFFSNVINLVKLVIFNYNVLSLLISSIIYFNIFFGGYDILDDTIFLIG